MDNFSAMHTNRGETVDNSAVFEKVFAKQVRTMNNKEAISRNIFSGKE